MHDFLGYIRAILKMQSSSKLLGTKLAEIK